MCTRVYVITIPRIAMVIIALAGLSTACAQIAEKQVIVAPVVFDPIALAQTIEKLKRPSSVDLFETPFKEILSEFTKATKLKFKVEASGPVPVTIKITKDYKTGAKLWEGAYGVAGGHEL